MKFWIARDINDELYLYPSKPICGEDGIFRIDEIDDANFIKLDSNKWTIITFKNSPQEVKLKLVKK